MQPTKLKKRPHHDKNNGFKNYIITQSLMNWCIHEIDFQKLFFISDIPLKNFWSERSPTTSNMRMQKPFLLAPNAHFLSHHFHSSRLDWIATNKTTATAVMILLLHIFAAVPSLCPQQWCSPLAVHSCMLVHCYSYTFFFLLLLPFTDSWLFAVK